jgi:hypothetical protein
MIIEERMYTLHVHKVPGFLKIYEREGLPIITHHLGNMIGFYITEVGMQNMIVHMWAYKNWEDREQRRKRLFSDPAWLAYRVKNEEKILLQETRIMRPAPFFEPVLRAMIKGGGAIGLARQPAAKRKRR